MLSSRPAPPAVRLLDDDPPVRPGSFVGRRNELRTLRQAAGRHRLVTLTGPGGCGKTRLLVEALRGCLARTGQKVWWADLASAAVDDMPAGTLVSAIGDQHAVLVLDTCERALDPCARLVAELIDRCPGLRILATSREALALPGEAVVPVPPLSVPPPGHRLSPRELLRTDAVRLFVDRARAVVPDFELTEADADAVGTLCVHLDGLPLAIELAASRVSRQPVEEILPALYRADGPDDPHRQASLRAVADGSHQLLGARHRAVLRRLSVLPRDAAFDAAEAVCAIGDVSAAELPGLLADLAAKSLLTRCPPAAGGGIRQLETIRRYAADRLVEAGERTAVRQALTAWLGDRATEFVRTGYVPQKTARWIAARSEYLALAVRWTGGRHLALATMYGWHLAQAGDLRAAARVLEQASLRSPSAPHRDVLLTHLAGVRFSSGARAAGIRGLEQTVPALEQAGNDAGLATALLTLGAARAREGEPAAAIRHYEHASTALTARGEHAGAAACRLQLAWLAARCGDTDRAERTTEQALPVLRLYGESRLMSFGSCTTGTAALVRGDLVTAESMFSQAVECAENDDLSPALDGLAAVAASTGRHQRAIVLKAAAERLTRTPATSPWHSLFAGKPLITGPLLEAGAYRAAERLAHRMTRQQLLDYVHNGTARPATAEPPLSRRENQVAAFVAAGLTNRGVAARLQISEQTVGSHITSIYSKLDLSSRCELATWLAARASGE
ncbi:LuxR C-terminal-related transcriptional regulator [Streptomyces sp. 4F14]|uniref:LuxR C-terminal-related transcriptional regulator n=1 Tax=Streptomyces sp. 4F14 TaxID=3394380 RepID=UPI003A8AA4FF